MRNPGNPLRFASVLLACAGLSAPLSASGAESEGPAGQTVGLAEEGITLVAIPSGRSTVIEPGWNISEVAVADETIADVKLCV